MLFPVKENNHLCSKPEDEEMTRHQLFLDSSKGHHEEKGAGAASHHEGNAGGDEEERLRKPICSVAEQSAGFGVGGGYRLCGVDIQNRVKVTDWDEQPDLT